jgi:streptogramin lyase
MFEFIRRRARHRTLLCIEGMESRRLLASYSLTYIQFAEHYDYPTSIVTGSNGNIWFTTSNDGSSFSLNGETIVNYAAIGEVDAATGTVREYTTPTAQDKLGSIINGPGGNLWFTDNSGLGSINPATHVITQYPSGIANAAPAALILGPDGNLWFTDPGTAAIGTFNPTTGKATEFPLPKSTDTPSAITTGTDGNIWFSVAPPLAQTQNQGSTGAVGNINPTTHALALIPTATAAFSITSTTSTPDGNLRFTLLGFAPNASVITSNVNGIDPHTGAMSLYPNSEGLGGLLNAPDGNLWYIGGNNTYTEIDPVTTLITTAIPIPNVTLIGVGPASGSNGSLLLSGQRKDASNVSVGVIVIATPIPANQAAFSGYVYLDPTATGDGGPGLSGMPQNPVQAGQTVFVDLGHDGRLDPGDPVANTDSYGYYTFTGLAPGTYTVRVVPYPGAMGTYPVGGTGQTITVAGGALGSVGPLGVLPVSTVMPLSYNLTPFGTANPDVQTAEVNGLYRVILGRAPDAAGGAAAVSVLKNGGALDQIVANLFGSEEYDSDVVTAFYHDYLNRAPDPAGQTAAIGYLQGGGSLTGLATILLNSPEFNALFPANATFVQALYGDILGRLPSANEVSGWLATFTVGATRAQVINGFLTSTEATNNAVGWLYATIYARSPDPAGQGQAYHSLQAGLPQEALAESFFASAEFVARANATVV